jgi:hypothetical protein
MALNLDKMRERLLNANNKGSGLQGMWKIPEGPSVIRIVSTADGDPFRDYWLHYNVGENIGFLCPKKNFGQECPVCEYASKLYRTNKEEDQNLAKKLFAKQRFFSPVLVRGEEDKNIRWWSYGSRVYKDLLKLITNEEYGDITDSKRGTDLVLDNSKPQGAAFPQTSIQPRRKESALCAEMTDERCSELLNTIPDLNKMLKKVTPAEIQKMLDEWILGGDTTEENPDKATRDDVEKYGKKPKTPKKAEEKGEPKKATEESPIDKAYDELMKE